MLAVSAKSDPDWLLKTSQATRYEGCAVVLDVLAPELIERTRAAMYGVQAQIHEAIGIDRLSRAGEGGVLRLMPRYDPFFLELLELAEMLAVVDELVSDTAILHLQNGFILPPRDAAGSKSFQRTFHRDFPRHLDGYMASLNVMLTLDEFTRLNGGTLVAPGTHQRPERPAQTYLDSVATAVECPAGAMIVFDSTLWHAAGANLSDRDRVAINHQFTRSFFKQQIDYVRALGDELVSSRPPRVQQLLGWYTRVVTSLDEYYRPAEQRLYRAGQG
ncbi:MAG TPA: phytanoyl-CoA dioxygenase family protein [Solirubrobacteraceae bacterium]|jgi:ectoine hydroxylase-related dioxygenase (phytanoyl-CoA dioxygenase family)|nr:phytanoyl-CoA dioxygenase family protein [Solirubrobacteraceae bacterium]